MSPPKFPFSFPFWKNMSTTDDSSTCSEIIKVMNAQTKNFVSIGNLCVFFNTVEWHRNILKRWFLVLSATQQTSDLVGDKYFFCPRIARASRRIKLLFFCWEAEKNLQSYQIQWDGWETGNKTFFYALNLETSQLLKPRAASFWQHWYKYACLGQKLLNHLGSGVYVMMSTSFLSHSFVRLSVWHLSVCQQFTSTLALSCKCQNLLSNCP